MGGPQPHVCIRQYVPVFAGLPVCVREERAKPGDLRLSCKWYPCIVPNTDAPVQLLLGGRGHRVPTLVEREGKARARPHVYRAIKPCVACLSDDRKREGAVSAVPPATLVTVHWHLHSYLDSSHFFPAPPIELTAFKASATRETSVPAALVAVAAVAALLPHNKTTSLPASPMCLDLTSSLFPVHTPSNITSKHIQAKHLHPADDTLELNIA
ncbi:uncharacterized protein CLUP02_12207 [Colletotrichum lupini]|uniref:Uncharacterized protein n=1 Tax=Colletotrichum lupini TaxID=145971 RepID=A0A9Q8WL68_9PEZI|nr:uncharacterized protein CLUP02_12207 [Colletotrichum lupini]UQC86705.1 hypothetical protein CLUP02_12207 [Colletotrichum lupini]